MRKQIQTAFLDKVNSYLKEKENAAQNLGYEIENIVKIKASAEAGNPSSQLFLARYFLLNKSIGKDFNEARHWALMASSTGVDFANSILSLIALCTYQGGDFPNEHEDRLFQFSINELSKERRDDSFLKEAISALIEVYHIAPDQSFYLKRLNMLLSNSAIQENSMGMFHIGKLHMEGVIFNKSESAGLYWLNESARLGNENAANYLGLHYIARNNKGAALAYFKRASELGLGEAHFNCAKVIMSEGVFYDADAVLDHLCKASLKDIKEATSALVSIFEIKRPLSSSLRLMAY